MHAQVDIELLNSQSDLQLTDVKPDESVHGFQLVGLMVYESFFPYRRRLSNAALSSSLGLIIALTGLDISIVAAATVTITSHFNAVSDIAWVTSIMFIAQVSKSMSKRIAGQ